MPIEFVPFIFIVDKDVHVAFTCGSKVFSSFHYNDSCCYKLGINMLDCKMFHRIIYSCFFFKDWH